MKTVISTRGRIVLPALIRRADGIQRGDEFDVERVGRGTYLLTRRLRPNEGLLAWLLACPEKGYFVAIDSESTASI